MDFWRTVLVLVRRWYITLPAFFAAIGVAGAAYSVTPLQYQSASVLVLTTPLSGGTEVLHSKSPQSLTNPLMNSDHSLALTASIVIQQMNSLETAHALGVTPGDTTTYLVTNGSTNPELMESGPFLFIQGNASSAPAAQDVTQRASHVAADVLARLQNELKAPASTHIRMQVVVPPTAGQPLTGSPARAAAAVGALAGIASLAAVYGFEALMTRRRRRRRADDGRATYDEGPSDMPARGSGPGVGVAPTEDRTRVSRDIDPTVSGRFVPSGSAKAKR